MRFSASLASTLLIAALASCGGADSEMEDTGAADEGMGAMDMTPAGEMSRAAPEGAQVIITAPMNGDTIQGTEVTVTLENVNIPLAIAGELQPGTGHHHLFLDLDPTQAEFPIVTGVEGIVHLGQMQTEHTFTGLTPGEHRIIALMADGLHFPFDPPVSDTVTFVVAAGG